jgi:hypothetical protein
MSFRDMIQPMDRRAMIEDHLALAERHVTAGERCVTEQRARVATLERDGHDTTESLLLLGQFQEVQELHVADRNRLRGELAELGAVGKR